MLSPEDLDALWDYGDPAGSETRFRERLPAAAGQSIELQLLTQIARAQGLQRRFDDAHATLDGVRSRLGTADGLTRARYLLERGRVLNSSGRRAEAMLFFHDALIEATAADAPFYAVDAAHMLAIAASDPKEQLDWNLRALAMAAESGDLRTRRWRGALANNIGWTYHTAGDNGQALAYLRQALDYRLEDGPESAVLAARWGVARVLRDAGQVEEALAGQQALLAETEASGKPDGYVHEELGECLLRLGREEEARPHFRQAYRLLSRDAWLVAEEPARLERLQRLG
jgi:tetratricopeptide (TPR) repeat protein